MICLRRSSNSPRYFVPARSIPRSRETSSLSLRDSGTSPFAIRIARPSTTAVFPVPASPIKIGLFFVRRERICMMRAISVSRPITGSSLSSRASLMRLRVYLLRMRVFFGESTSPPALFLKSSRVFSMRSFVRRKRAKISRVSPGTSSNAKKRCSVETNSSLSSAAIFED